jgi:predicted RNase H-like nuclease
LKKEQFLKFIGVDLGWSSGASGLCCLAWDAEQQVLNLIDLQCYVALTDILTWIDQTAPAPEPALVAVDAPTLIPNQTGMRLPDRLTHQYFGKHHAGCYPANLSRPFADRTTGFGRSLEERGFAHAPNIAPQQPGRYQIEVFPHAAMIGLFQLDQILKYKKGRLAQRQAGLQQLRDRILTHLPQKTPRLHIAAEDIPRIPSKGKALKDVEDRLDSIICAYTAAYWWRWGEARNYVLGDRTSGYIIVPQAEPSSASSPDS